MACAGCSNPADLDAPAGTSTASVPGGPVDPDEPVSLDAVPAWTDTFHLHADRGLNKTPLPNRTVVATLGGVFAQTFTWNATLAGGGNLTWGSLDVWVDLPSSAVQLGSNGDPNCSATLTFVFTRNGTNQAQGGGCGSLGSGSIPPGEYLLNLGGPMTSFPDGVQLAAGDGVLVQLTFTLAFPQGQAYVLSGGDRNSRLWLDGLQEPV